MFSLAGFDPQRYTDEDIIKKMTDLHRKLMFANRFSLSYEMITQLQTYLNALEFERRERIQRSLHDMRDKLFPDVIESDPGLRELEQNAKEKEKAIIIGGPEIRKSQRPFSQSPLDESLTLRPTSKPQH